MATAAGLTWLTERLCRRARPAARSVEVIALFVRAAPLLLTNTVVLSSFVGVEFDANASARTRPALSVLMVPRRQDSSQKALGVRLGNSIQLVHINQILIYTTFSGERMKRH